MGTLAGMLYGSWAIYANWQHGLADLARAASVQFILSFFSTSFLTLMMELILVRGRAALTLVFAATIPYAVAIGALAGAHWLSGTPNVMRTIAPSALIGLTYCVLYVLKRIRIPDTEASSARHPR